MHLGLVSHRLVIGDGQGRVNYEIARYALERGARVTALADEVAPELLERGAKWWPIQPVIRRPMLLKVPEFVWRANRLLKARGGEFDLVCGNGYVLTRPHAVNCAHFVHGAWLRSPAHISRIRRDWYGFYQLLYTRVNAAAERQAFGQAAVIVAVSAKIADELVSVGMTRDRIRVIPNGVDVNAFRPGETDRRALNLPAGQPLALFVGDLRSPRKNLETVLTALQRIPKVHLVVVGDTRESRYPAQARAMGLDARVHFLGYRLDIPEIMRASDILVFPSRYEPFGLVVLEAMASGLPVITAASVGAAPLVTPECGFVLRDSEDVAALGAALETLVGDPELRRRLGCAARREAEIRSWERMAAAYWALFAEFHRPAPGCSGQVAS